MIEISNPWASRRTFSMIRLMASVRRWRPRRCRSRPTLGARQVRRIQPIRATSGRGQLWKLSNTLIAISHPLAGTACRSSGAADSPAGHVHLIGRVARLEAVPDFGLLLLGEVFCAVAEQPADLV
jgi:hypothetical protein